MYTYICVSVCVCVCVCACVCVCVCVLWVCLCSMQAAACHAPCESEDGSQPSPAGRHGATVSLWHVSSCCRWVRPNAQSFLRVVALSLAVLAVANPTSIPAGTPQTTHRVAHAICTHERYPPDAPPPLPPFPPPPLPPFPPPPAPHSTSTHARTQTALGGVSALLNRGPYVYTPSTPM
jgi:hypothetical protein